jgi:hypothetical protein
MSYFEKQGHQDGGLVMSSPLEERGHSYQFLKETFENTHLFEDKTWKLSPHAWPITKDQLAEIKKLGQACLDFHKALEILYLRSTEGKKLLRNKNLVAPWVADYLDRGKPHHLIKHGRCKATRGQLPSVIRPDLLLTEDGFALTEIDSVPGGIGLTAFLNRLYAKVCDSIIGDQDAMLDGFYRALASKAPDKHAPLIAVLVSDEAATYKPEMVWVCEELQKQGKRVFCFHPDEVYPLGDVLHVSIEGNPEKVDVIYRFFELFDLPNLKTIPYFFEALEQEDVELTPPMRAFQEEKLSLGLFHHSMLQEFWRENLPRQSLKALSKAIPKSWIMDHTPLPPTAVLDGPLVGGKPIREWTDMAEASQKERNLIIKISGFHETAWGARSVTLGSDSSRDDWNEGIQRAVELSASHLHVLQEYRKPRRLTHPIYGDPETTFPMQGRIRLCPYFFANGETAQLAGILATFCPADKKIIHGMRDAAMLPCHLVD